MAGYIVKVVIEDTHPPVWRRIILPEMITLADLHQVLQCAFQWDDYHLHRFEALKPKKFWLEDTEEDRISADLFLQTGKEMRYVYDFGDDWKHRILFEKEEPEYDVRYATVIKYKGDSFEEDSGGAWLAQSVKGTRIPFDM